MPISVLASTSQQIGTDRTYRGIVLCLRRGRVNDLSLPSGSVCWRLGGAVVIPPVRHSTDYLMPQPHWLASVNEDLHSVSSIPIADRRFQAVVFGTDDPSNS
jgi:hypothetical protein